MSQDVLDPSSEMETALALRGPAYAKDLRSARVDQLVALNHKGEVTTPARLQLQLLPVGLVASLGAAAVAAGLTVLSPVLGLASIVGVTAAAMLYARGASATTRVARLVAAQRYEDAQALLARHESCFHAPAMRAHMDYQRGAVAWRLGQLDRARLYTQRSVDALSRSAIGRKSPAYWLSLHNLAQLYAVDGDLDTARQLQARTKDAPDGDFLVMEAWFTQLCLAFHEGSAASLPDDIFEWVRDALASDLAGGHLVLLAWAYEARGDSDMADHLLESAQDRLEIWSLESSYPKLDAWLSTRER